MNGPEQLTLWPDDALPGQMPLFNRQTKVFRPSEITSCCCLRCEAISADYLAGRDAFVIKSRPAAEPIWEPTEWFGKRPAMVLVPAASSYL